HISLQFLCSPYHTNSPLYPFVRQLEFAAGFDRHDSADQKLDKLEAALEGPADVIAEATPLLAALLSIPYSQRYFQLETRRCASPAVMRALSLGHLFCGGEGALAVVSFVAAATIVLRLRRGRLLCDRGWSRRGGPLRGRNQYASGVF